MGRERPGMDLPTAEGLAGRTYRLHRFPSFCHRCLPEVGISLSHITDEKTASRKEGLGQGDPAEVLMFKPISISLNPTSLVSKPAERAVALEAGALS